MAGCNSGLQWKASLSHSRYWLIKCAGYSNDKNLVNHLNNEPLKVYIYFFELNFCQLQFNDVD